MYVQRVKACFEREGNFLTEADKLEIVRKKVHHHPAVGHDVDARLERKHYTRLSDFRDDQALLFSPRFHAFMLELKERKQTHGQPCTSIVGSIKQICFKHWPFLLIFT
jgi:hypothetical protein